MSWLLIKAGMAITWFGTWVLLMVVSLSFFYHPDPLWITHGVAVIVKPVCLILFGLVLNKGIAENVDKISEPDFK